MATQATTPHDPLERCIETLAKKAAQLGHPTEGVFAERLWNLSNFSFIPVCVAIRMMNACGYEAFKGYPLERIKVN